MATVDNSIFMPVDGDFRLSKEVHSQWRFTCRSGTKKDDLVDPDFWAHVAHRVKEGDIITVRPKDNSFYAELYVVHASEKNAIRDGAGEAFANVELLFFKRFERSYKAETEDFYVEFRGDDRWSVIRKANRVAVRAGFADQRTAYEWMNSTFGPGHTEDEEEQDVLYEDEDVSDDEASAEESATSDEPTDSSETPATDGASSDNKASAIKVQAKKKGKPFHVGRSKA